MEKISVFNYEAFYLDYLEGNLNGEDTALLLAFLDAHPECMHNDLDLPVFHDNEELVYLAKNDLKMFEGDEAITLINYQDFMIQSTEGIIGQEKKIELDTFIEQHQLESEMNRFAAVYFEPSSEVVFRNKLSLKQKRAIVLWPYFSAAAAAACIILFFTIWNSNGNVNLPLSNKSIASEEGLTNPKTQEKANSQVALPIEVVEKIKTAELPLKQIKKQVDRSVTGIKSNPSRPLLSDVGERKLEPITERTFPEIKPEIIENQTQDYASTGFNGMQNPIEPITRLITDKTNTDVDFRRQKPTNKKAGGFYVKVGKFEFSHKKH